MCGGDGGDGRGGGKGRDAASHGVEDGRDGEDSAGRRTRCPGRTGTIAWDAAALRTENMAFECLLAGSTCTSEQASRQRTSLRRSQPQAASVVNKA